MLVVLDITWYNKVLLFTTDAELGVTFNLAINETEVREVHRGKFNFCLSL